MNQSHRIGFTRLDRYHGVFWESAVEEAILAGRATMIVMTEREDGGPLQLILVRIQDALKWKESGK